MAQKSQQMTENPSFDKLWEQKIIFCFQPRKYKFLYEKLKPNRMNNITPSKNFKPRWVFDKKKKSFSIQS